MTGGLAELNSSFGGKKKMRDLEANNVTVQV